MGHLGVPIRRADPSPGPGRSNARRCKPSAPRRRWSLRSPWLLYRGGHITINGIFIAGQQGDSGLSDVDSSKWMTEINNHSANEINFTGIALRKFRFFVEVSAFQMAMSKADWWLLGQPADKLNVYSKRSTLAEKPPYFFPLGELKLPLAGWRWRNDIRVGTLFGDESHGLKRWLYLSRFQSVLNQIKSKWNNFMYLPKWQFLHL